MVQTKNENEIPDVSRLVEKLDYNAKITGIEDELPSISSLAINAPLTALKSDLENKTPDSSSLVKKHIITQKLLKFERNLLL